MPGIVNMAPVVLGYTNTRGLAQSIRNLLVYKGVPFEEKQYKLGPAPGYEKEGWLSEKFSLGLQFPNLPYYTDGDVNITQSIAILRHLARKHDLNAKSAEEATQLDLLEQQANDLIWGLVVAAMSPAGSDGRRQHEANLTLALRGWEDHLKKRKWALGDRLTYVDFLLYEGFAWNFEYKPEVYADYPSVKRYMQNFEALPKMKEYFASPSYIKWPIMGPNFQWGFKK
uniref:glutathione transferase n=1 Tax=Rhipicephalus zambeziensis TaxID=60191 RepID=A0A224YYY9_9ACAR